MLSFYHITKDMIEDIVRSLVIIIFVLVVLGPLQTNALSSGNGLEVWPNLTSITLLSNTPEEQRILICKGNEPIQWYYRQYDGSLLIKKNISIKVFPTNNNKLTYLSMLSLKRATYLDTGNYICTPSIELKYFKDVYIFVYHEIHLLAIPEDFKLWYDISKYNKVIGPFRPTSPDVNVTITTNTPMIDTKFSNDECFSEYRVCNGFKNCDDNSDEDELMCKARHCRPERPFKCSNGECLFESDVCNGVKDCNDNSDEDELMCKARSCGLEKPFKCNNNKCIHESDVCDGIKHCIDGSDENEFMCKVRPCKPERPFKCSNGNCIREMHVCDGNQNCIDGSDENEDMCRARPCPGREFKCSTGKCIVHYYVCNGVNDCSDGSDEDELICKSRTCGPERSFKCKNGKCIPDSDVCNNIRECNDGSDEDKYFCKARPCRPETPFKCNSGRCIREANLCDGNAICFDGSDEDEEMCKARPCDPIRPFKCSNGKCIRDYKVCDGIQDCIGGTDEDEHVCKILRVKRYTKFDDKKGFEMDILIFYGVNIVHASKNNITDIRLIPNPVKSLLRISDSSSGYVIIGQNVTLNCSLEFRVSFIYMLTWIVPDTLKNKTHHIQIENYFNGSVILNIENVSTEDEGYYNCVGMTINGQNYTKTYKLNAYSHDVNYLTLVVEDGVNKKIRPVGYNVQWTIKTSSSRNISLEWIDPNGRLLESKSKKTSVKNNNGLCELILKNLQLSDSGFYRLAAYNDILLKEIEVTLFVEDKPKVLFIKGLNLTQSYYEIGKNYTFEFYISGYPLPNVKCAFIKCPKYPNCEQSRTKINEIMNDIHTSDIAIKIVITMNITDTGILICNASNILGNDSEQYTILATDISNDLEVRGASSDVIITGDNITIICGASIYNYLNNIKWNYPNNSQSQQNLIITEVKSEFSFVSKLIISNISKDFNGYINCTMERITRINNELPEIEVKSIPIKVEDTYVPVINNLNSTSRIVAANYGKMINLSCFTVGIPRPTISWFQGDQPLLFDKNDSRISMQNGNQTLLIKFNETKNHISYTCKASNTIGSVVLTYTLKPILYANNVDKKGGVFLICSMLILLSGIIAIVCVKFLKKEKTKKKSLALIEVNKLEKKADDIENPIFWLEVQEYMKVYKRWNIAEDKLKLGKRLGSGAFGVVFKAKAIGLVDENTTSDVAVKTVNSNTDLECIKALVAEFKVMIHVGSHLNVVNLLGVCLGSIHKTLLVIVEYCRYGSIHQYMLKNRKNFINQFTTEGDFIDQDDELKSQDSIYENMVPNEITKKKHEDTCIDLDSSLACNGRATKGHSDNCIKYQSQNIKPLCTYDLINWSFQVGRGMEYLASKKILHGDLATRNILLAEENIVKICDFGLSSIMYDNEIYTKNPKKDRLPIKWMAIESIRDLVFSTQSDVWSFGVVLWEMFTLGACPYAYTQYDEMLNILVKGYRMEQPMYANSKIYKIILDCWKTEPKERPSFIDLTERLGDLLQGCSTKSPYANSNMKTINESTKSPIPISPKNRYHTPCNSTGMFE